ncbi:MAG: hypothetical protein ACE5K2_05645 [Candidatus Zixiibacteriota bacterium]
MEKKFRFVKTHWFVFLLITVLLISNLTSSLVSPARAILKGRLYKGDKVTVKLGCQIGTDTIKVGTQFTAEVKEEFRKGEDVYIYKGDPVFATVESVKKPGWYGRGAELVIRFDSTLSTGGTFIPLKGKLTLKGKNKKTLAYVLFFIGWAIKGKNVQTKGDESCVTEVNVPDYIEIEFKP